jgi:hypothetical protein
MYIRNSYLETKRKERRKKEKDDPICLKTHWYRSLRSPLWAKRALSNLNPPGDVNVDVYGPAAFAEGLRDALLLQVWRMLL